ncbi:MAG: hypothetical protein OXB84_04670, partial [Halobacteriovoraceae bacterium]|nr:hypothetical protein [Halobacteriovoraceae bacterium]
MISKKKIRLIDRMTKILGSGIYLPLFFFFITSCSVSDLSRNTYGKDNDYYKKDHLNDNSVKKIVVVATGNFEGNLLPVEERVSWNPRQKKKFFKVGGAAIFSSYIRILRARYHNQVLLLDGGNL